MTPVAYANTLDDQINDLNNSIKNQQGTAAALHAQGDTLAGKIAQLNAQISQLSYQIQLGRAEAARLAAEIAATEADLAEKKQVLNESIRQIYQQSQVTPLEMLASSKNFSDYVDKQQYMDRIKDHVQEASAAVQKARDQLVAQQTNLNAQLASQSAQQGSLDALRAEQNSLLAQTRGEEAAYQQLVASNKQKLSGLYAQRAALDAKNGVTISTGGGNGGYPWANNNTSGVDPYGYYYRQCVSFAAWHRFYYKDGQYMPDHWGNAGDWVYHAPSDRSPEVGAIAVFPPNGSSGAGGVGHVAIVIGVHGGTIDLAEYNWRPYEYDTRYNVPIADMKFIH